jgi:hypothetical protein
MQLDDIPGKNVSGELQMTAILGIAHLQEDIRSS